MGILSAVKKVAVKAGQALAGKKGGVKNVVAVAKSIVKGKGVQVNLPVSEKKKATLSKIANVAVGSPLKIATTALAGAGAATLVKAGLKAGSPVSKVAQKATSKVLKKPSSQKQAKLKAGEPAPPTQEGKVKATSQRRVSSMGIKKKKGIAWYRRQISKLEKKQELIKLKAKYQKMKSGV